MIDRMKIGKFLRELRNEKGITQEDLAEKYGVSSRSVSRWENGNTLPELGILVELADYYEVEIREMIDGERKSEIVEMEKKETLIKIADYVDKQKRQLILRAIVLISLEMLCCGYTIAVGIMILSGDGSISAIHCIIPMFITFVFSVILLLNAMDYVRKSKRGN